ncbi:lysine 2,3-aminomutase [Candidatus Shapirobacteria bacterium CG11_big_fil_rev_8_21_14_0_20_40_12]|uniref:Lysine 2,3-aminomutase n=1 Tax=Candidatus Shapirobacteria bacterium CG11_big_fil_rev_8_21_14_0_20_40_12 TaxID=1974889 RepID=A0A2H0KGF2_9BACT|nr:MAG: lysine 2,3-aminomutase [Candidatus Shapirobacteria bacterium CG11_big_fil_rev_8_21_14_0_20_40_12]
MKEFKNDPLCEEKYLVSKGLIHKYPCRVLILISSHCPKYCDFCFRKRITNNFLKNQINKNDIKKMIKYVLSRPEINEVIFSGGEPLTELELLLFGLRQFSKLKQIKILRIHSRAPVTKPSLVEKNLLAFVALSKKPIYFSLHVNHPKELSPKTIGAITALRQAGAILLSQTVFLKNLNDNFTVLKDLFTKLTEMGVRPYYLHHCDPVTGNEKYLVPLEKEIEIATRLRRELSGLACPTLVIDTPDGNGKIPVPLDFWEFNQKRFKDFNDKEVETL